MWHNQQLLTFSTRKELALLLYLAVEGGMHPRHKLALLLWPDSESGRGRAALRSCLYHLHTRIDAAAGCRHRPHLKSEHTSLGLDETSDLSLDVHTLQQAWKLARTVPQELSTLQQDTRRQIIAQLEHASRLIRGPFLEGFSLYDAPAFEDWVRFQHAYWSLRLHTTFDQLSHLQEAGGESEQAIETVNRWLSLDPLHEEAYVRLMRLHFVMGDRAAALQTYAICRNILATELNAEPSAATVALAERIRNSSPTQQVQVRTPSSPSPPATLWEGPLVGRTREFSSLIERYQETCGGLAQVVLVEGEVGMGKTRLVTAFADWARAQGAEALYGRALDMSRRLLYQPLVDALRPRLECEQAPGDLLADVWLAELARLLPELRERFPVPASHESMVRLQLFEAVARLVRAWTARHPLVLVLDDMHWADAATLDLVQYLAGSWVKRVTPVLLLLSWCPEEVRTLPAVTKWLSALEHSLPVSRLALGPLSAQDTLHWLYAIQAGRSHEQDSQDHATAQEEWFGRWLYAETGGNPLYLHELLKALLERGVLTLRLHEEGVWGIDMTGVLGHAALVQEIMPPVVRDMICARLDRLSPPARALLTAGAVLDKQVAFDQMCRVANLGEDEGLAALDELLCSHLLTEVERTEESAADAFYTFTHKIVRKVVFNEVGATRQRILQRRARSTMPDSSTSTVDLEQLALAALDKSFSPIKFE